MSSRRNSKSLFVRIFSGFLLFFCTACFSAVFFGSIDYFHSTSAIDTDISVNVNSVLSIRIAKNNTDVTELDLSVAPNALGAFVKDDVDVIVSTSNATGYSLTMADNDTDTSMHHTDSAVTSTIASISTNTTEASFPVNSWGYSLDPKEIDNSGTMENNANQTFSAIPSSTTPASLKTTDAPTTGDTTPVTFATKVDTTITAGTYQDTVVFSAVTNYVPTSPLSQISNMQEMTPEICEQSTIGDEAILTDTRDNNTYVVRKLADNRCWMVQNLALGGSSAITLTPADSNVAANFTLSATTNSFGTTNDAAGININRMHDNGNTWLDPITPGQDSAVQTSGTPPSQTQYMGNYYNWYTATAGSGTYEMNTRGNNATQSICPKGWRLPTGGAIDATTGNGEVQQLYDAYGNYDSFISATSAVLSGRWNGSSADIQGVLGGWWSSTVSSGIHGYGLLLVSSSVSPQSEYINKNTGYSIRCIADDSLFSTIDTMQAMTPEICASAKVGDEKILRDARDGNTYTIRKMEDNKCWMTQNLRLGSTSTAVTLTSADSDVTSSFTIPTNAVQTSGSTNWSYDEVRVYNNGNAWIAPTSSGNTSTVNTTSTPPSQSQYIGNYYNWYTATAGTGTQNGVTSGNASSSICPKGWKLPTGSANSDFTGLTGALVNITTNTSSVPTQSFTMQSSPNYFVLSGYYNSGVNNQGSYGRWWSRTAYNATNAYNLGLTTSGVSPQYYYYKYYGYSVRCIAE